MSVQMVLVKITAITAITASTTASDGRNDKGGDDDMNDKTASATEQ